MIYKQCWDSMGSIVTCFGLDLQALIPAWDKRLIISPKCPEWFWGPLSPIFNGCQGFCPWGKVAGA